MTTRVRRSGELGFQLPPLNLLKRGCARKPQQKFTP